MVRRFRVGGITIQTTHMDLPIKKGLSSSAAISVLTARAYNQVYGLGLSLREEMECAYHGEIMTGSECGRMDQVCAYGPVPVFLTFDAERMDVDSLHPQQALHLVIIDLQRGKDTRKILHQLNSALVADSDAGAQVRMTRRTEHAHSCRRAYRRNTRRRRAYRRTDERSTNAVRPPSCACLSFRVGRAQIARSVGASAGTRTRLGREGRRLAR